MPGPPLPDPEGSRLKKTAVLPPESSERTLGDVAAAVAQLEEHMICNLEVGGSSPPGGFSGSFKS